MPASSTRLPSIIAGLLAVGWLGWGATIHAQGAEGLLEQGVLLFNQGEFERSLQVLRRAQPLVKAPQTLGRLFLYLGLDYAFLGKSAKARQSFATALDHDASLDLDPSRIKESVVKLFRQVRDGLRGELRVLVNGEGATVLVDGQELGAAPLTRALAIGPHRVEVRSPDGGSRRVSVVIQRGKSTLLRVSLRAKRRDEPEPLGALLVSTRPRGATVWVDGKRSGTTPTMVERLRPGRYEVAVRLEGRRLERRQVLVEAGPATRLELELVRAEGADRGIGPPRRRRIWTWVAGGGALLFAGIGIGVWRAGVADYEVYQVTNDPVIFNQVKESIPKKFIAADVMLGLAGALAATSVVLFFVEGRSAAPAPRSRAGLELAPTLGGLVLHGRY
jgi:hypothetical protein